MVRAAAALDAQEAGELALAFPTVRQIELLLPFATADEALAAFRGQAIKPILPKVVGSPEDHRVVLPGGARLPRLSLVREGSQAGVPGAGRIGVEPCSSISPWSRLNSCPAFLSASLSSSGERSRRRQRNQSWQSLIPKLISPVIVVVHARKPGLNSSRRAIGSYSFGTEAMKRLLKSTTRTRPCGRGAGDRLGALDRLDVEGGDDLRQVGHVGLGEDRRRQHRLAEKAAGLLLVGVAGGPPEAFDELAGEPVGAAHAERHRRVLGVDPADRLVGEVVALAELAHRIGPFLGFLLRSQSPDPMPVGCDTGPTGPPQEPP